MKYIIYSIIGIFLALIESAVRIKFFGIGLSLDLSLLIGLATLINKNNTAGKIIIISGAVILDLFSPYRFGIYFFQSALVLFTVEYILNRPIEIKNPFILWLIFVIAISLSHSVELLGDPLYSIFLSSITVNSILGFATTVFFSRILTEKVNTIEVSDNVCIR